MPCVVKETSDLSQSPVGSPDRPNAYKPKYQAFSIDSLVGNSANKDRNSDNDSDCTEREEKPTSRSPSPTINRQMIANTAPMVNGLRNYRFVDENRIRLMAMQNQNVSPFSDPHMNASHRNSQYISNISHTSDDSSLNNSPISQSFVESIQNSNAKYDNMLNMRSNVSDSRNGSPERPLFGNPSLQSSPFNSSQYYNQLYWRLFEERLIQTNPYLLQICGKCQTFYSNYI